MAGLSKCTHAFAGISVSPGQQLKDQAQLDSWARGGFATGTKTLFT